MKESAARAQEAAHQAKEASNSEVAVDWSKIDRQPFRRVFLDAYQQPMQDKGAVCQVRETLGIQIESDPAGVERTPPPIRSFSELSILPSWITEALAENKWATPMAIQAQALPILLSGKNLIGIAQTGSGKTGAFLLPAVIHVAAQRPLRRSDPGPIVLVLAPTRELAVQISEEAEKVVKYSRCCREHPGGIRSVCFYGGGRKSDQLRQFTFDGSHIVVATPGRLMDFCKDSKVSLQRVTYLCLDEADRMLDMGFSGDMEQIGNMIRPERQTVFFSATWPKEVQALACQLCIDTPVTIRVGKHGGNSDEADGVLSAREGIKQEVVVVDFPEEAKPWDKQEAEKKQLLDAHIKAVFAEGEPKMIIFVNQKNLADELSDKLWKEGIFVDAIHGGKPQEQRLRILDQFRKGQTRLLIATDVIGRGLDIPEVSHVVIYDMNGVEDYIHRIGRTGRGKDGRGHAFVLFEYAPTQPDTAKELVAVLEKSKQAVPPKLLQIAEEVAKGKRWSRDSAWKNKGWGGGGSNSWSSSWKSGGNWSGSGSWKEKDWKASDSAKQLDTTGATFVSWKAADDTSGK